MRKDGIRAKSKRMPKGYSGSLTEVRKFLPTEYKSANDIWRDIHEVWSPKTVRQVLSELETLGEVVSKQEPIHQGFRKLWKKA
jgi:hypothetical protein